jgi:hypothetical protein
MQKLIYTIVLYFKLKLKNAVYNTIQYNTIQYNTIQYNTIQYNTIQYNTIQYNTIQYNTIQYNKLYLESVRIITQDLVTFLTRHKNIHVQIINKAFTHYN